MNLMTRKFDALRQGNDKLMAKLKEHGISQDTNSKESDKTAVANVSKQKIQNYQGECYKKSCSKKKQLEFKKEWRAAFSNHTILNV